MHAVLCARGGDHDCGLGAYIVDIWRVAVNVLLLHQRFRLM